MYREASAEMLMRVAQKTQQEIAGLDGEQEVIKS
jgi:hypothetical protein